MTNLQKLYAIKNLISEVQLHFQNETCLPLYNYVQTLIETEKQ